MKKLHISILLILAVLFIDQFLKIYIKTNFFYEESAAVFGDWFRLVFVENRGMAFGWQFPFLGEDTAKILLSSFRIVAVFVIGKYMINLSEKNVSIGLMLSVALIFAGALGNIIDSALYGLIFTESSIHSYSPATFTFTEGYAREDALGGFLTGRVVDMLRFDLFTIDLPWYGSFNFFAPIFNIADVSISVGVGIIILFQRKAFQENFLAKKE